MRHKDKPNTWAQKATVLSEIQPRSYTIQTEDSVVLRRNHRDLLKGPATAEKRTDAAEQHQHTLENPSPEAPAQIQEQTLRKFSRNVRPPERLIEQI